MIENQVAMIDVYGARKQVSLMHLPQEARVGDYVLVHAGFAIQKIDRETVESGEIMHEASLALSILDIVVTKCRYEGSRSVDSVKVRIGRAAGIMPESLVFAFDALKANTEAARARLDRETVSVGGACNDCTRDFAVEDPYVLACPLCGSHSFVITRGREMEVVAMEIS